MFFFRRFFGNSKQIIAEILSSRKILPELDRKIAELGQDSGPVKLYLQGFCLIRAQLAYFFKVFAFLKTFDIFPNFRKTSIFGNFFLFFLDVFN